MTKQVYLIIVLSIVCVLLSVLSFDLNAQLFHYPGNTYLPKGNLPTSFLLTLLYFAAFFRSGLHSRLTKTLTLFIVFYVVFAVLTMFANAAQFTPFQPIDRTILKVELFDLLPIVTWTKQHPTVESVLNHCYDSVHIEMMCIPLLLIAFLKKEHLYEYCILILLTAIIGFGFYYFYPTTGPASVIDSPYFDFSQRATGIKFFEMHQHIPPSTRDGGLIALPSFHVLWACLITYASRPFRLLYWALLPFNAIIVAACVMLGWHYFTDVFGSMLVLFMAHSFCKMHRATAKWCETRSEDHPCIQ